MALILTKDEAVLPGPYAILSHTWAEEEVTFDDIETRLERTRRAMPNCCSMPSKLRITTWNTVRLRPAARRNVTPGDNAL